MPVWIIEFLGSSDLDFSFLIVSWMTAPIWLLLLLRPQSKWVSKWANPFVVGSGYLIVWFFLFWQFYKAGLLPGPLKGFDYSGMKDFSLQPMTFLLFYCSWQILNLILGTLIFQKAFRCGLRVPAEILLCWFFGPVALAPFIARLIWKGKLFK